MRILIPLAFLPSLALACGGRIDSTPAADVPGPVACSVAGVATGPGPGVSLVYRARGAFVECAAGACPDACTPGEACLVTTPADATGRGSEVVHTVAGVCSETH